MLEVCAHVLNSLAEEGCIVKKFLPVKAFILKLGNCSNLSLVLFTWFQRGRVKETKAKRDQFCNVSYTT